MVSLGMKTPRTLPPLPHSPGDTEGEPLAGVHLGGGRTAGDTCAGLKTGRKAANRKLAGNQVSWSVAMPA